MKILWFDFQFILEQFDFDLSVKIYLAILLLPLIFLNWIRNLKLLSPVMTIANLCMSVGLGIIFYYIFRDIRPIQGREEFNVFSSSLDHLALYFGTAIYAFEGIGMVRLDAEATYKMVCSNLKFPL